MAKARARAPTITTRITAASDHIRPPPYLGRPRGGSFFFAILFAMKKPRDVIQPPWGVYRLGGKKAERMAFSVTGRTARKRSRAWAPTEAALGRKRYATIAGF